MTSDARTQRSKHQHRRRLGRAQDVEWHDPYRRPAKLHEPSVCSQCGAVYKKGRWTWAPAPPDAEEVICQTCHRINDRYPAGVVMLTGKYLQNAQHRSELLNLIRSQERTESAEHPHNRIIEIQDEPEHITVTTTDIHLPRRIGEAIRAANGGELSLAFEEDGYFVRITWERDQ